MGADVHRYAKAHVCNLMQYTKYDSETSLAEIDQYNGSIHDISPFAYVFFFDIINKL